MRLGFETVFFRRFEFSVLLQFSYSDMVLLANLLEILYGSEMIL